MKRLDPRSAVLVGAGVTAGVLLLFLLSLAALRMRTQRRVDVALADIERMHLPQEEVGPSDPAGGRWHLHEVGDVAGTLAAVQSLGEAAGVTVDTAAPTGAVAPGRLTFEVAGRGRPDRVCTFVAALEQRESLLVVAAGRLLPANDTEIAFSLSLTAFHRQEGQ